MTLHINRLTKTYANGVQALTDVSLSIAPGVFGLLGPNGSGKSTLMRTIATLQRADSGTIRFRDIDVLAEPQRLREVLGYLPQDFGLYPNMSAESTLDHFAVLRGVVRHGERKELVKALLEQVNLYPDRRKSVGGFSGGMKQRLGCAIALIGTPGLLIVDEPTAGLDPGERNRLLNVLAGIGEDVVVILSTHIVEDVREVCSSMAIINNGFVVRHGTPQQLVGEMRGRIWSKTVARGQTGDFTTRHRVVKSSLMAGDTVLHVYSEDPPGDGLEPAAADLAHVYFHSLERAGRAVAGGET